VSSTLIRTYHYTCDRQGCDAHGSGSVIPDGWRYLQLNRWIEPSSGKTPPADTVAMLLCPPCVEWLKTVLHVRVKLAKERT
jgi:hypothetical protein